MDFGETFPIKNSSFKEFTLFLFDTGRTVPFRVQTDSGQGEGGRSAAGYPAQGNASQRKLQQEHKFQRVAVYHHA